MSDMRINESAVAFVSDWKTRTDKQQKKYVKWFVLSFLFTTVVCAFVLFWYQNKNYERIVDQNMKYVQDSALQESKHLEKALNDSVKIINYFADRYVFLEKVYDGTTVIDKLEILNENEWFDRVIFVDSTGFDTSLEGTAVVSDREYFQKGIQGESGWYYLDKSRVTGKTSLVFYAPVNMDGEIIGVLVGFYERERIEQLFSYELFNYEPRTFLLLPDGTVVAHSQDDIYSDNVLQRLSEKTFIGDVDYGDIQKSIQDDSQTTITFSFVEGKETIVGVIVQFADNDWMMLSLLPYDITRTMIYNANKIGSVFLIAVTVVLVSVTFLFIVLLRTQQRKFDNEMANAADNLHISFQKGEKQLSIINSLANIYTSVYYFELTDGTYQRINENGKAVKRSIPDTGMTTVAVKKYIDNFIADSYKEQLTAFLDYHSFKERLKSKSAISLEYRRKDGEWRSGILIPAECNDDGTSESIIFAVREIDMEKQKALLAKQALEEAYSAAQLASRAKTTFLSNMSHDIRTPMNAIVGMTAIAAANIDNTEKVKDCLKRITSSSKHLLGLINNVLDMSKIESDRIDLNDDYFRLSDLIDDLITLHQPLITEKNHTLIVKVNNVTHENVIGDSTRLQQVFTNLLSNAIKYTPNNGTIEITLSEKETNKPTIGWYEVVFKDNGIGIEKDFLQTLFQPFARASDHRISNIQGTGLGMPIAKNIIRMMNGDITVESEINKGSTFTVSFALKLQVQDDINYDDFIGLPVLVVDDDVVACESTCAILESLKMKSEWVTSGAEAIQKVELSHNEDNDYYAIIIDWKMPEMNGIETTREIRKRVGRDIPIIVISAYYWADIEQEAREAGVDAFLSKPVFRSKVVDLFSSFLGKGDNDNEDISIDNQDFSGKRILLAEDNAINREVATELFSMMGIVTDTVENGQLCVEKFESSEADYYDLIFMDIQMPVMNGYDATKAIRKLPHKNAKSIPIVAMTANGFSTDVRAAFNAGMNGHLSKPLDITLLIKTLKKYFD